MCVETKDEKIDVDADNFDHYAEHHKTFKKNISLLEEMLHGYQFGRFIAQGCGNYGSYVFEVRKGNKNAAAAAATVVTAAAKDNVPLVAKVVKIIDMKYFEEEYKLHEKIDNLNLNICCKIYDTWTVESLTGERWGFIIMERLQMSIQAWYSKTIRKKIKDKKYLECKDFVTYLLDKLKDKMIMMYKKIKVVHGDLHVGNVMINTDVENHEIYLIDFGSNMHYYEDMERGFREIEDQISFLAKDIYNLSV